MTQTYFPDLRVRQRLYEGPLAIYIDAFAAQLTRQGYSGATAREKLRLVAHLSRWLDCNKLRAEDLNDACMVRFRRYRRRLGRVDHQATSTCKMLLAQLREAGVRVLLWVFVCGLRASRLPACSLNSLPSTRRAEA
jgi:hypothetical protein